MINSPIAEAGHRVYFPGLNAVRAYAALAVIFSHVDQNVSHHPLITELIKLLVIDADSAVSLFFVLSGFLITYLLLYESDLTGTVAVRKFYIRRILRIWPLYYAIVIIGLLIFPLIYGDPYITSVFFAEYPSTGMPVAVKIALALCLLPNFASISAPMEHIWSIGVEEQYYAFWPWVIRKKHLIVKVCVGILFVKFLVGLLVPSVISGGALRIHNEFRFECMAIGSLGAYLYFTRHGLHRWIYHPVAQLLTLGALAYMAGVDMPVNVYVSSAIAFVFAILILNLATNPNAFVKLNNRLFDRLGKISYGLYLYHFPVLYVILQLASQAGLESNAAVHTAVVFLGTLGATWLVAEISYRWFEGPFLNMKERNAAIQSFAPS